MPVLQVKHQFTMIVDVDELRLITSALNNTLAQEDVEAAKNLSLLLGKQRAGAVKSSNEAMDKLLKNVEKGQGPV